MKTQFRISRKALEDIDKIWIYTFEKWSTNQANYYYRLIYQEINFISENYESGKSIDEIKPGYRQVKIKSHLIIYKKGEDGVVEIVRVLHQKMDIPNQL
jgi:toxin ParE1/3/4